MSVTRAEVEEIAARFRGMVGPTIVSGMPLERDAIRRFVQATMDADRVFFDDAFAQATKFGGVVAPALYPVHAFRPRLGADDPLDVLRTDPDADGAGGNEGVFFGLPVIESPLKRLLNGGNEIAFYRNLAVGERCTATARYADVTVKESKNSLLLLVTIETTFRNESGQLLLVNRQTLIWR